MLSQGHKGQDSSCMLQVCTVADLYFLTCSRSPFLGRKQHAGSAPLSSYTAINVGHTRRPSPARYTQRVGHWVQRTSPQLLYVS